MALFAASSCTFRLSALATAALVGAAAFVGPERAALADNVSPDGKGIVGGGLLGAELVTIVEGIADVHSGWAYGIGAIVGAGGGAVGGYFVEQQSSDGKVPTYLLAGGLALIIPAIVLTLNGTRYRPQEGATDDNVPAPGPTAEPGSPSGGLVSPDTQPSSAPPPTSPPTSSTRAPADGPALSLVDLRGGALRVGVPAVDVRPVFSLTEQRQYGMHAQTEIRMPVLRVAF
jgi:hypothetical protein